MNCLLVYNPHSGTALSPDELRAAFTDHGYTIDHLIPIDTSFERELKQHMREDSIVAVIGGDGTISSVASLVADAGATLLPLSGGTLNHFTKDLGVAQELGTALKAARHASPRAIDIASVNGRYFINNSSIGLYPSSLHIRERFEDKLGKWPAAVIGALRALFTFHRYHLTINGEPFISPFVFVGNNTYKLGQQGLGERDRLDAGILSVIIISAQSRLALVGTFLRALVGKLHDDANTETFTTQSTLIIHTHRKKLNVSTDGEVWRTHSPLTYKLRRKKLRVLGP